MKDKCLGVILIMALAVTLFVASSGCGATNVSAAATDSGVSIGIPPRDLWSTGAASYRYPANLEAVMRYDTPGKSVSLFWRSVTGVAAEQQIALDYFPTRAIFLSDGRLCVAGKRGRGATTLDLLEIVPPSRVQDLYTLPRNLDASATKSVTTVFEARQVGQDMVRLVNENMTNPDWLFVQFWDSRDLYSLDLTSGAVTLVASPTAQGSAIHAPSLVVDYSVINRRDHIRSGYLYIMALESGGAPIVVLVDSDRDGVLDDCLELTAGEWGSQGYGDAANYNW